jgi:putative PIN family toxin of toxin-antitoxin system
MPNVVLDASVIVSAALKPGSVPERAVFLAIRVDALCLSAAVIDEYREVLGRPKFRAGFTAERVEQILALLIAAGTLIAPTTVVTDCPDAKDNKYLELAIESGASAIVSGDADLLRLDPWRGIRILSPAEYVRSAEGRTRT